MIRGPLQQLAVALSQLPEWLDVRRVAVETPGGETDVPLRSLKSMPSVPVEGPFTLRIDIAPVR